MIVHNGIRMARYPDKNDLVFAYERGCTRAAYESMIDTTSPNLALMRIFAEGNVVDEVAQKSIFSDGVTISTLDVARACAETRALMADSNVTRINQATFCLLYTSPSPRDLSTSRMPSSA